MSAALEVPVLCEGSRHLVLFTIDSLDRVRARTLDHDPSTEAVLVALGGRPTACALICRAERDLRHSVPSAADRVRWAGVGVTGPDELDQWRNLGIRSARVAWRWVGLGITSPGQVAEWKEAGFRTPEAARPWIDHRFPPDQAGQWRMLGRVDHALPWVEAGFGPSDAGGWAALGVDRPSEIGAWEEVGVHTDQEALTWARAGVSSPLEVQTWWAVGALDASDAVAWWESGVGPEGIARWMDAGVACGRELAVWRRLGVVDPAELHEWRASGVPDGLVARRWVNSGVRSLTEVVAWSSVGVLDPAQARPLSAADEPPPAARALQFPWTPHVTLQPQVISPPPDASVSAVTTELYHYAYGRPCPPDEATDVMELDIDAGGWEVARRHRPLPNGRRPLAC